eukprot:Nk52_evm1s2537 gene=Nk52_evmTU1s2537
MAGDHQGQGQGRIINNDYLTSDSEEEEERHHNFDYSSNLRGIHTNHDNNKDGLLRAHAKRVRDRLKSSLENSNQIVTELSASSKRKPRNQDAFNQSIQKHSNRENGNRIKGDGVFYSFKGKDPLDMNSRMEDFENRIQILQEENFAIVCAAEEMREKHRRMKEQLREIKGENKNLRKKNTQLGEENAMLREKIQISEEESLEERLLLYKYSGNETKRERRSTNKQLHQIEKLTVQFLLERFKDQERFMDSKMARVNTKISKLKFQIETIGGYLKSREESHQQAKETAQQQHQDTLNELKLQLRDEKLRSDVLRSELAEVKAGKEGVDREYKEACERFQARTGTVLEETRGLLGEKERLVREYKGQIEALKEEKLLLFEGKERELCGLRAQVLAMKNKL